MTTKGIIYYTHNQLAEPLFSLVQEHIKKAGLPISSASLKPLNFGDNVVVLGERSYPTMVKQIIAALEQLDTDYVFFCEHDVLYDPSHFEFTPPKDDLFYYNDNCWRWWQGSKDAIRHDRMLSLSNLCVNREFALDHYNQRLAVIMENGWDLSSKGEPSWARKMGYEPGTKQPRRGGFSDDDFRTWSSRHANLDVRHPGTFSSPKTKISDFKHKPKWWEEIPVVDLDNWYNIIRELL